MKPDLETPTKVYREEGSLRLDIRSDRDAPRVDVDKIESRIDTITTLYKEVGRIQSLFNNTVDE